MVPFIKTFISESKKLVQIRKKGIEDEIAQKVSKRDIEKKSLNELNS